MNSCYPTWLTSPSIRYAAALVKLDVGRDGRLAWLPIQLNLTSLM